MRFSTIVLAGGKGSRFQKTGHEWIDKLLAKVNNKPMILNVLEKVIEISHEVIISTNTESRGETYKNLVNDENVKVVVDKNLNCSGPLRGITSSARELNSDNVLIIPADIPFIKSDSLINLVKSLGNHSVSVPLWYDGMTENLLFAVKREYLIRISSLLCHEGYWSPSGVIRGAPDVLFKDASEIISDPIELININYIADLEERSPRRPLVKSRNINIKRFFPNFDLEAPQSELIDIFYETDNSFILGVVYANLAMKGDREMGLKSAKAFDFESRVYYLNKIYGLEALCYQDAGKVLKNSGYRFLAEQYFEKSRQILEFLNIKPEWRFL